MSVMIALLGHCRRKVRMQAVRNKAVTGAWLLNVRAWSQCRLSLLNVLGAVEPVNAKLRAFMPVTRTPAGA